MHSGRGAQPQAFDVQKEIGFLKLSLKACMKAFLAKGNAQENGSNIPLAVHTPLLSRPPRYAK